MKISLLVLAGALALASCARPPLAPSASFHQCIAALDQSGIAFTPAPIEAAAGGLCTVDEPVRVTNTAIAWSQPGIVACRFALTLDDFVTQSVEPLARAYFGKDATVLRHFGTYACRTTSAGRESLHAVGEAIDVAGFVLDDGTVVSVEHDWRSHNARGRFLHAVARAACSRFSLVLTPDSDRDHWNHIHLDAGPYRRCGVDAS